MFNAREIESGILPQLDEPLRFYVADGNLEEFEIALFTGAGFEVRKLERVYRIKSDDPNWDFKQIRPQDQPYFLAMGSGEMAIIGRDILREFELTYPKLKDNVEVLEEFKGRPTRLVAVISNEVFPEMNTLDRLVEEKKKDLRVASEYPQTVREYLATKYDLDLFVYKPAGKTEALLVPPRPEMDLIFETTETGTTIQGNNLKIVGEIMSSPQVLIANSTAYSEPKKKLVMNNLCEQLKGVARVMEKKLVRMEINVFDSNNVANVTDYLRSKGFTPTTSPLSGGGADVYVVVPDAEVKRLSPVISKLGGSDAVITSVSRLIYPSK